jgi:hypothetical protein
MFRTVCDTAATQKVYVLDTSGTWNRLMGGVVAKQGLTVPQYCHVYRDESVLFMMHDQTSNSWRADAIHVGRSPCAKTDAIDLKALGVYARLVHGDDDCDAHASRYGITCSG